SRGPSGTSPSRRGRRSRRARAERLSTSANLRRGGGHVEDGLRAGDTAIQVFYAPSTSPGIVSASVALAVDSFLKSVHRSIMT
ncbi:MAG TPA: hypothetical protein VGI39_39610, partial [Polyangiaceae bacterium]